MGANGIIEVIKKTSSEAMEASKPAGLLFGTVVSTKPLAVKIDQKLIIRATQLSLARCVTEFDYEMTVEHTTETNSSGPIEHTHPYRGRKRFTAHLALAVDERVALLRAQGGQRYFILDRVVEP